MNKMNTVLIGLIVILLSAALSSCNTTSEHYRTSISSVAPLQTNVGKLDSHSIARLQKAGTKIYNEGKHVRLVFSDHAHFKSNQSDINTHLKSTLSTVATLIQSNKQIRAQIQGNTDNVGSPSKNKTISDSRARTVLNYLTKLGVPPKQLTTLALSDTFPKTTNATMKGRRTNRRVEIVLQHTPHIERTQTLVG